MRLQGEEVFYFGDFTLIPGDMHLSRRGQRLDVSEGAISILAALVRRAGLVVSIGELIEFAGGDRPMTQGDVQDCVEVLRETLREEPPTLSYIVSVPGSGFQFIAPARSRRRFVVYSGEGPSLDENRDVLVGRDPICEKLLELLPGRKLITLVGAGGIGKTALARVLAQRGAAAWDARAAIVELEPLHDETSIRVAIAAALGVSQQAFPSLAEIARAVTGRLVLVLDGAEHVLDLVAAIAEVDLSAIEHLRVIVTSREPLRAQGEWVQRLHPLKTPPEEMPASVEAILDYPAVQLFIERALAISDVFEPSETDISLIATIVRKLDGIPLALELAAARVDMFGLKDLSLRLDKQLGLLSRGTRTSLPRHRTMRSTIDWSYKLLSETQRRLLERLSVFATSFYLESASSLADAASGDPEAALHDLVALVEKSLIVSEAWGGHRRYRLLSATREFATERLEERGDAEEVRRWHARYVLEKIAGFHIDGVVDQPDRAVTARWGLIHEIRAAVRWCIAREPSSAVAMLTASEEIWRGSVFEAEWRTLLSEARSRLGSQLDA